MYVQTLCWLFMKALSALPPPNHLQLHARPTIVCGFQAFLERLDGFRGCSSVPVGVR